MCNIFSLQRNVTRTTLRRQFIFKELTGVKKLFWDSILTMWGCLSLRKNVQEPVLHRTSPNSHALENTLCMCRKKKLKERKERKRKKNEFWKRKQMRRKAARMQRKQTLSLLWMGVGTGAATVSKEKQSHGKTMEASRSSCAGPC